MAGLESAGLTIGNQGVWCARLDSNQHCTALEAAASAVGLRAHGRLDRIRTDTGHGLSVLPLPGPEGTPAASLPNMCGQSRVRTSAIPMGYRIHSPALSASQPTAQTRIVKDLAEGRRLERLCPEGPWLSRPVGYQLPEPSGQNYNVDLEEITDLVRNTKSVRLRVGTIGGRD